MGGAGDPAGGIDRGKDTDVMPSAQELLGERFDVPAGITGLWQVTARAHASFGEALDLDVSYARHWSLGLDLMLLLRTPFALLQQRKGTA